MTEQGTVVSRVDFSDQRDLADYLAMLDAYALDPMGAGQRLPPPVLQRLADELPSLPGLVALLARHDGEAIGFATCLPGYSTFRARPLLNIHDIAVLPEWRGRGIARYLLQQIEQAAVSLGCCAVTLEVRDDNARARALYRDFGFGQATCGEYMEKSL